MIFFYVILISRFLSMNWFSQFLGNQYCYFWRTDKHNYEGFSFACLNSKTYILTDYIFFYSHTLKWCKMRSLSLSFSNNYVKLLSLSVCEIQSFLFLFQNHPLCRLMSHIHFLCMCVQWPYTNYLRAKRYNNKPNIHGVKLFVRPVRFSV